MLVYNHFDQLEAYQSSARVKFEKIYGFGGLTCAETTCAFPGQGTLTLRALVPRVLCASGAVLKLYRDDDMSNHDIPVSLSEFADAYDVYETTLELASICAANGTDSTANPSGLFYYTFGLETPWGALYTGRDGSVTPDRCGVCCEQLLIYDKDFTTPDKFRGGMMYQIFPDRFSDGGKKCSISGKSAKKLNPDWNDGIPQFADVPGGEVANDEFFGGNLYGVAANLDYIKSLGVDTIYLCPIFEAASNHRYDTGDYLKIDGLLGGGEAFDFLLAELKKRKMKLILDGVFNHTGADSRYFNKCRHYSGAGAYNSKRSRYYGWYTFTDYPDEYRCWWGVKILPAVKSDEPSYLDFICGENGVIRHYLKKGIDGWRLDVADELSDVFLNRLRSAAKTENPESIVLGEVWEDASDKVSYDKRRRYFRGGQLDSVMNYPLKEALTDFILTRDSSRLYAAAEAVYSHYPKCVCAVLMNFLGTHDTERILTVLADAGTQNMTNDELSRFRLTPPMRDTASVRLKLAWALLAAFPGLPCIYYGDESGMEGGRDPFNRMPFVPGRADAELTEFYRLIGRIHSSEPAFSGAGFELIDTGEREQFMFLRYSGKEIIAVAANLSCREWVIEFETTPERLIHTEKCTRFASLEPDSVEYFKF